MLLALALSAALAADTTTYPVLNHGRPAGEMHVVRDGDSVVVTYAHIDRNRGRWLQTRHTLDPAGRPIAGERRPMTRTGEVIPAVERFRVDGDSVRYERGDETLTVSLGDGFYAIGNSTPWDQALLVRHLLNTPGGSAVALPGADRVRLEIAADTTVSTTRGPARVRLAMLHGDGATPRALWVGVDGDLVASAVGWFITVHPDFVPALPALREIETRYRNAAGEALARRVPVRAQGSVVIRNADVFDAERGVVLPRRSIVVSGGRIVEVGPAAAVRAPRGATVIDAAGKTVIPGMWDMHTHLGLTSQTSTMLRHLAIGVTTVRDLASDVDMAVSHRDRADSLRILSPRILLGGFIEGPQRWAGPTDVLVSTESEARAWVARYDSLGYRQIKLYNLVHPDLLPAIASEARARGMRLSGHVPRGLSIAAAIRLGMEEINHAAFLFSDHHPDSLYVPEMRPYSGVAAIVAPNTDVDGPEMTALIEDLRAHDVVVDGTFNLWMRDTTGVDSATARRGNQAYLRLVRRLHEAGVVLVPGTDGSSFNDELELYERAGIPAPEVLRIATLGSARVMGEERDYGSIRAGKVADLVIVDGSPHERISDLRNVHLVMRAGRVYEPAELTDAVRGRGDP